MAEPARGRKANLVTEAKNNKGRFCPAAFVV